MCKVPSKRFLEDSLASTMHAYFVLGASGLRQVSSYVLLLILQGCAAAIVMTFISSLQWILDLASFQKGLYTNSTLLRRYWADVMSEWCALLTQRFLRPLWSEQCFVLVFAWMFLGWAHLCIGIRDDSFVRLLQSFDWLAGPIFLLACSCMFHTTFLHLQDQGMTNALAEILWRSHFAGIRGTYISQSLSKQRRCTATWITSLHSDMDLFVERSNPSEFWEFQSMSIPDNSAYSLDCWKYRTCSFHLIFDSEKTCTFAFAHLISWSWHSVIHIHGETSYIVVDKLKISTEFLVKFSLKEMSNNVLVPPKFWFWHAITYRS